MNAVLPSPPDDHARRIVDTVNRFGGTLHAARCMAQICTQNAASPAFSIAAKYGLQMTFGTSILTLRKFQDLWSSDHLPRLLEAGSPGWNACDWIRSECEAHRTREAANLLFAHYAEHKTDPPLSSKEIRDLVERGGWATEEEVVEWIGPIIDRLREVRDEVMRRHGISALGDGGERS
jgi:hypothetical protein